MDLLLTALPAPTYSQLKQQPRQSPQQQLQQLQDHPHHQRKSQRRRRRRRQSVSVDTARLVDLVDAGRSHHQLDDEADCRRLSDAGRTPQRQQRAHQQQQQQQQQQPKGRTVYYSLRQTESIVDGGVNLPGAPPATPLPVENPGLKYVLSLQDTKSKRELALRLTEIRDKRKDLAKQSDLKAQLEEREREQARVAQLHIEQRNRIYALNKLMTELELTDFKTFRASRETN